MDEVHFQQYGSRCRMWVPPEVKEPILLHAPSRKSVGYFGAVRLRDGRFVYRREDDTFNGQTCFDFLRQLRTTSIRTGRRVVVISDNASFHHSRLHKPWRASHEENFELYFLPAYSPDFQPVERVWKFTRRLATHNRYFANLDAIATSVQGTFDGWARSSETLRRLCAIT